MLHHHHNHDNNNKHQPPPPPFTNNPVLSIKEFFFNFTNNNSFIQRILVHMINHRVQEFSDPLTSTLVLMATSALQIVFCETGLLLFKTNLLPVIPYSILQLEELSKLHTLLAQVFILASPFKFLFL